MKKLIIIALCLALPMVCFAEEPKKTESKEVKYEVIIEVKFNELPVKQAIKIATDAAKRYKDGCEVEIKISKNINDDSVELSSNVLEFENGDIVIEWED